MPIKVTHEDTPGEVSRRVPENLYEETLDLYYRLQEAGSSAR